MKLAFVDRDSEICELAEFNLQNQHDMIAGSIAKPTLSTAGH